jgi:signal transduction histidine kinase
MNRYDPYLPAFRYSILTGAAAGTLLTIPSAGFPVVMLGFLLLAFNTQLRFLINNNRLFLVLSSLFDAAAAYYLSHAYSRLVSAVLLVTLADILLKLEAEAYPLTFVITPVYAWCTLNGASIREGFVFLLLYLAVFLLFMHTRRELSARADTEALYDRLRDSNYELEATRARLLEYSKQVETNTRLEERNRISRELHDTIGHKLAGILMQVDAAIQVMEVDRDKGMEIIRSAHANINESMDTVRETVRRLNPSGHAAARTSVRELAERFSGMTGIAIDFKTSGIPYDLYPSVETVLYRNLQEAFTNSVRHGHATRITVQLIYKPNMMEAVISDNGPGCGSVVKGFGLRGMEERLEIIDGSMEYDGSNGFTIHMKLPGKEV